LVENIAFTSFVERLQVWTCCTVFCFVAIELSASGDQTTDIRTTFDFAMIAGRPLFVTRCGILNFKVGGRIRFSILGRKKMTL
jgi:hypothetical protein